MDYLSNPNGVAEALGSIPPDSEDYQDLGVVQISRLKYYYFYFIYFLLYSYSLCYDFTIMYITVSRLLFLIQIDLISPFIIVSSRMTNVLIYLPVFYTFYIVCTLLDLEDHRLPGNPGITVTSSSE